MRLVDSISFVLMAATPGIVVLVIAVILLVRSRQNDTLWGTRLLYMGTALMMFVPGIAITALVLIGRLQVPALFGALVMILFGSGILYGLRLHWANPWHGSLGEDQRPPN